MHAYEHFNSPPNQNINSFIYLVLYLFWFYVHFLKIKIYSLYPGDSLGQFQTGLHFTFLVLLHVLSTWTPSWSTSCNSSMLPSYHS
jgi:hypothetical protein